MCDHCDVMDSILMSLVGRKVTDAIMKRVVAELHSPTDKLESPSIDCGVSH